MSQYELGYSTGLETGQTECDNIWLKGKEKAEYVRGMRAGAREKERRDYEEERERIRQEREDEREQERQEREDAQEDEDEEEDDDYEEVEVLPTQTVDRVSQPVPPVPWVDPDERAERIRMGCIVVIMIVLILFFLGIVLGLVLLTLYAQRVR